jgi:hypothetical protein
MLREADLQVGGHPRHGVDRDRDSFTAPDVAFLEQDMRHTAITAVDDEPFDVAASLHVTSTPISNSAASAISHLLGNHGPRTGV